VGNEKKAAQLGMPFGTAQNRLRKLVLFNLLQRHGENTCFRCGDVIESVEVLSLEHKRPWLDAETSLFWDVENIGFSHLRCNVADARKLNKKYFTFEERQRATHEIDARSKRKNYDPVKRRDKYLRHGY
jgi:hypothetical protein